MTELQLNDKEMTMTSREIAELTEKQHKNVCRDIRVMLEELEIDAPKFELIYLDALNREQTEYKLNKQFTLTLVSGYNTKLRHAIVQRWQELESQNVPAQMTYIESLKALIEAEEEKDRMRLENFSLERKILEDKPKVVFADAVTGSTNLILVREFAKVLSGQGITIGQNKLFQWFRDNNYLSSKNEPYQQYVAAGYFEVIERVIGDGNNTFTTTTTKITGAGQTYFASKIEIFMLPF